MLHVQNPVALPHKWNVFSLPYLDLNSFLVTDLASFDESALTGYELMLTECTCGRIMNIVVVNCLCSGTWIFCYTILTLPVAMWPRVGMQPTQLWSKVITFGAGKSYYIILAKSELSKTMHGFGLPCFSNNWDSQLLRVWCVSHDFLQQNFVCELSQTNEADMQKQIPNRAMNFRVIWYDKHTDTHLTAEAAKLCSEFECVRLLLLGLATFLGLRSFTLLLCCFLSNQIWKVLQTHMTSI